MQPWLQEEKRALLAENSIVKSKLQEIERKPRRIKNDLKFERDGVIADNKKLENKVEELKLKINGLDLHLHAANLQLSDVNNAVLAAEEEKRTLLTENSVVKAKLQEAELRIDSFQTQFGVLNEQNSILQSKVQEAEKDANDLKFERDGVIADNKKLENKGKVEEAEKDTNDFKIERDAVIGDNKQLYIKVKELQTELETTNVRLHDLEKLISSAKEQKENMVSEISVLTGKITHAQLDNLTLEKRETYYERKTLLFKELEMNCITR
ncbi:hypothetical protein HPP92_028302 [Vanilla planifolia]|uniref:Uncharacterized protein n=1 Tax=Vanilla planifolia TaxID=51239 RepID=A0A835U3Z0_VANPL|nr:hypothetical protein HPP92_028302 [Vanilla planifolia]